MTHALLLVLVVGLPDAGQLRQLPGVVEVTANSVEKPTHRIVHLLNWHQIPEDRFRLDDPNGDYQGFLDEVEAVVVMGGAPNLSDTLPVAVQYVRVKTRGYKLAAE